MLYRYDEQHKTLEALAFYDYAELKGKEKDLENLLAEHLGELYVEDGQLMPIFQERQWQAEPDLCALDRWGNLIIFELKRGVVSGDTTIQVMRYGQAYGQKGYGELNRIYQQYSGNTQELGRAHADAFQLEVSLQEEQFNQHQKMVIVGCSSDRGLLENVDYWKAKGVDIDFLPYRFYRIAGEVYFDFFAKPYDDHINPRDGKGIMFDTNRSYHETAIWDMFAGEKVSAYGKAKRFVERFNKGDYVLYYHAGWGIVGAGRIKNDTAYGDEKNDELYRKVELLTPAIAHEQEICCISPAEIKRLLNHKNFWWANTVKIPYLTVAEAEILIEALQRAYAKGNSSS